ncbi:MAG: hypothetical protein AB2L21_04075 [Anaerolineaceae bacterium]
MKIKQKNAKQPDNTSFSAPIPKNPDKGKSCANFALLTVCFHATGVVTRRASSYRLSMYPLNRSKGFATDLDKHITPYV